MFNIKSQEIRLILLYLFFNPKKSLFASELASKLKLDVSNTAKALRKLDKEGIIKKEKRGGHWFYFLNNEYPMLKETKKIFLFKYGLDKILKERLKNIKNLEEAYIFGSYAKGELEAESDIDILLIGDHEAMQVIENLNKLKDYFGREFNTIDMTEKELKDRKKNKDGFIEDIFNNKTIKIL
jgi:predicted nucleotidyltransferase